MRKLDKLSMRPTEDTEASAAEATIADQGLAAVFAGPGPIDKEYFSAFRNLLPAARALSDADYGCGQAGQECRLRVLSLVVIHVRV
jgi:hypothetical protein